MSDGDKAVNDSLAGWLFDNVMKGKAGASLDIGAAYPYLASRLQARCCDAWAIEGDEKIHEYGKSLGLGAGREAWRTIAADFENDEFRFDDRGMTFDLITCIHSAEHFYRPLDAMRKLRGLLADDGHLFIRMPDHNVPGIERDMTPGHFTIHPFVHTLSSILQCCAETECFEVESYVQMRPGQADIVLSPL
jgi:SAM-dependent methyltransferase